MGDKSFVLEIVTPRKVVYSGDVVSFSAPGVVGNFQVLLNHAPMLAQVGIGEVKLRDETGSEIRYATSGGFVDVRANHVVMLAETAEPAGEIDQQRATAARDRAMKALEQRMSEQEREARREALQRALNRLRVAMRQ